MFEFSIELGMMTLNLDIIQSISFTTIMLLIGSFIKNKVHILNKY